MRLHRFWLWIPAMLFCAAPTPTPAAPGDRIFDDLQIHEIRFEFAQADWYQDLEDNWKPKKYMPGAVTVNGTFYDSVGVRFKGFTSYRGYPTDKKPFRIKFNKYRSYNWDGLQKVSLNNAWGDPTLIKEKLHLDFLRRHDSAAPRGNFARVYVNDEYWGFYGLVEHVDKIFLDDRLGDDGGNLYKARADALLRWEGPVQSEYYDNFDLKTNESENDWSDLVEFIGKINNTSMSEFPDSLESIFNPSTHLLAWAINNITNNWDSYLDHDRNYYVYHHTQTDLFEWINWDMSLTLGGGDQPPIRSLFHTPFNHPLHFRMIQVPKYESEYLTNVGNLVRHDFQSPAWEARIDELAAFVEADYLADTRRQYNDAEFTQGLLDLKLWIRDRITDIEGQISIELMDQIVINELMFNPAQTSDVEYIELYNQLPTPQDIGEWKFMDGVQFSFPSGTILPAESYAVLTNDRARFVTLHGEQPRLYEWTSGDLANDGERVALVDGLGLVIDETTYESSGLWPSEPDGGGPSLELIHPSFANHLAISWLASDPEAQTFGTPGAKNSVFSADGNPPVITSVAVQSLYVGRDYNYRVTAADADGDTLHFSLTSAPTFLSIDPVSGQMSGTALISDVGSHTIIIEVNDGHGSDDEQIYTLEVAEPDPTYAVVINELHYNPAGDDSTEFIELVNTESFAVDMGGWYFNDGVGFVFPPNSPIGAGEYVIVARNISAMATVYRLSNVDLYQWTSGGLANSGETVELSNATQNLIDTVPYGDRAPWPESPDGDGPSLALIDTRLDNSLPSSWEASGTRETSGEIAGGSPGGIVIVDDNEDDLPGITGISATSPNPFRDNVVIRFALAEGGPVNIGVFDVMGRRVTTLVDAPFKAGSHSVPWDGIDGDGRSLQPGVYFLRLHAADSVYSRQMVLLQ